MYDFSGKTIMITGGASGIGLATAKAFTAWNANVAVIDMRPIDQTIPLADDNRYLYIQADITKEAVVAACVQQIVDHFGHLHLAYNNAGIGGDFAPVHEYPTDDWDKVMAINLKAVFLCMKYQIRAIMKAGGGAIVNCASLLASVAYENDSAYVVSKFGVLGLTKNAALEYANKGIRINCVSPGFTNTPMVNQAAESKIQAIINRHPIGRLAEPHEIAAAVGWLCSDASSFAIGLDLRVDGGYTLL